MKRHDVYNLLSYGTEETYIYRDIKKCMAKC